MSRLLRDSLLIAVTATVVWFARGDAVDRVPVAYEEPFFIHCSDGRINNAQVLESPNGVSLTWSTRSVDLPSPFKGHLTGWCAIYTDEVTP